MKILLIFAMALALSADARPQFKWRRGLMHVKRQDNSRACVRAANNLADLIEMREIWDPTRYSEVSFEEFMSVVSPIDTSIASERERFLCSLEALTTVSEAVAAMDGLGSIEHFTSVLYAVMVANAKFTKAYESDNIHNPEGWMDESYLERLELDVQFVTDLEASGFLNFEQNKVDMFVELMFGFFMPPSLENYTPAAPSNLPLDQQCSVVANDARLLWNRAVKDGEQWNPEFRVLFREQIRQWTGIQLGSHEQMRGLICTVMEAVVNNGPHGLYQFLMDEDIIEHVAAAVYPYMIQGVQMLKYQIDYMVNAPPVSYTNYNSYPQYGPSQPSTEVFTVLKDLLDNLEAMGFFSLS